MAADSNRGGDRGISNISFDLVSHPFDLPMSILSVRTVLGDRPRLRGQGRFRQSLFGITSTKKTIQ